MIYLKSGQTIEGIVEKETPSSVTINIGSGSISLNKSEINHINKYSQAEQKALREQWSTRYFMLPENIPEGLKDLVDDLRNMEDVRKIAIENKKTVDKNKKRIKELEDEAAQFKAKLSEINAKISTMKPEANLKVYNSLIEESNILLSKLQVTEYEREGLEKSIPRLNKGISGYVNDLNLFRKNFTERYKSLDEKNKEKGKFFFEGLGKKIEEMDADFTQYAIDYNRSGSSIVVEALLNDLVKVNFIVDTGASIIVISREVADKLNLMPEAEQLAFEVVLADGSKAKAKPIVLKSVKVGSAVLMNVPAAIIDKKGTSDEDGLLGMSFLKNFLVRINTKENKLILEEFNP